jgi:DNA-binding XRE family transcriptional regulator
MKAQALTNATSPGGRPRRTKPKPSAFAQWLRDSKQTPEQVAKELGVAKSSVYNLRNGYFAPGLDLAVKIAEVSGGAVPPDSWPAPRKRRRAA